MKRYLITFVTLAVLLVMASRLDGQNSRFDAVAQSPKGPIPFALVAICTQPANTGPQPCTPLANICSSLADLTCNQPNPILSDNLGNYHFYAQQSQSPFTVQIYGPQVIIPYVLTDQTFGAGLATSNVFTGTNTFNGTDIFTGANTLTGTSTLALANGVYNPAACATNPPSWCAGSDMGAWINAAYAALPAAGGEISIPAGAFSYSTPIVASTSHKPVRIHGSQIKATTLTFTPTTGIAMTIDTGTSNYSSEIDHLLLVGPGVGTSTTGIACGSATNNGSIMGRYDTIQVTAFGTGLNMSWNCFAFTIEHSSISNNNQDLLDTVGQENMTMIRDIMSLDTPGTTGTTANCVQISNSSDWHIYSTSFDNCQLAMSSNTSIFVHGAHFENPAQNSYDFFVSSGNTFHCYGCTFNQDNGSSFPNNRFGSASVGNVAFYGGNAFSPLALGTFVNLSGTASAQNFGLVLNSSITSGWVTSTSSGYASGVNIDGSGDVTFPAVMQAGQIRGTGYYVNSSNGIELLCSSVLPTISSGFNAGTIGASANGTCSFFVNVGSGTAGSTGVLTLPAATSGWNCSAQNQARADHIQQTANSTTSSTLTNFGTTFTATNWTNGDPILVICVGR